jgi:hypothetical protein
MRCNCRRKARIEAEMTIPLALTGDKDAAGFPRERRAKFRNEIASNYFFLFPYLFLSASFFSSSFKTGSHYVAQAGLKLMILLTLPLQCWDYRYAPQYPIP